MYFDVNFNVFFKLIKVHLLVSELYIHQNPRCNNKNKIEKEYFENNLNKTEAQLRYVYLLCIYLFNLIWIPVTQTWRSRSITKDVPVRN